MDLHSLAAKITTYLDAKIENGICLALSGGVDSALLLYFLSRYRPEAFRVLAATFHTPLLPGEDFEVSAHLASLYHVQHQMLQVDVLEDRQLLDNPVDRCYRCKKLLFSKLGEVAGKSGIRWIVDGTNADDLHAYRPGLKALKELGVCSPWAELGVGKDTIRKLAKKMRLPVADRPSAPCLATRFPYGVRLDEGILQKLDAGEKEIRKRKVETVRLRYHDGLVRIEVPEGDLAQLLMNRTEIVSCLKELGFRFITLDLEGFRSGSMDKIILNSMPSDCIRVNF